MKLPAFIMKRIFICSPDAELAGARDLCRMAIAAGHAPFAPHLLYPGVLDDSKVRDRELGITCGLCFLDACDEVWAYVGRGQTPGMAQELVYAKNAGKRIRFFNWHTVIQEKLPA
jgi:hypothetical protein